MRILTSRKFRFYSPDKKESVVSEGKNIIQDVPDWVVKDGTFQAAKAANLLQVLSTSRILKEAENNPENLVPQNAHDTVHHDDEPELPLEEVEEEAGEEAEEVVEQSKEEKKAAAKKARRAARKAK